ncbi:spore germination protein KB [Thalassobacillus cyri]|uniref:Spore germination protein KB n=1 Tax=Thalassobacillus cyri TaxID=571932 RepID=A0A1H3XMI9_9BACI|nr:endospore germination permease [Thalassobacillus cyri]SEA00141.1 spore germination protein KB [Thalassobacillus cyri]
MGTEKISAFQLFVLIVLFEMGSAVVLGFTFKANQDSWMVILFSMIGGLLLYLLFTHLSNYYPALPLTEAIVKITGPFIGPILAFFYIIYFFYLASRVLGDFTNLMQITILRQTPFIVITIVFTLMVCVASILGLEVIARTAEMFYPLVIFSGTLFLAFVYLDGLPDFRNLLPVLDKGWEPIFSTVFPQTITFPFGEMIVFMMFFPYLISSYKRKQVGVLGIIVSGIILTLLSITILAVLGSEGAKIVAIPLLETISLVNIQDIIQRMDPIVIITMIILGFIKITLFFYAAIIGLHGLFQIPRSKRPVVVISAGLLLIIITFLIGLEYTEHVNIGLQVIPYYVHVPMQLILPLFLVCVAWIRGRIKWN